MTGRDQSPREVSVVNLDRSTVLLAPRQLLRVGAWNVRTMYADYACFWVLVRADGREKERRDWRLDK